MPGTLVECGAPVCEIQLDGRVEVVSNDDDERLSWGIYWHYLEAGQEVGPEAALFEYTYDTEALARRPPRPRHEEYPAVFLSYRQADANDSVRLHEALADTLGGPEHIFPELVPIEGGDTSLWAVQQAAAHCQLMVLVIGPAWMDGTYERGRRPLDSENERVRREVTAGLDRGIPTIPVLLSGATVPSYTLLDEMGGLENLQMLRLRRDRWETDLERLIATVRQALG
jgi:hypothetical protein